MQIIIWWEARRIPYNIIVGISGVLSLIVFYFLIAKSGELQPGEDAVEPIALLAAPLFVNICYTLGWIVEIPVRYVLHDATLVAPALYGVGTVFSLFIVWLPTVITASSWLRGFLS